MIFALDLSPPPEIPRMRDFSSPRRMTSQRFFFGATGNPGNIKTFKFAVILHPGWRDRSQGLRCLIRLMLVFFLFPISFLPRLHEIDWYTGKPTNGNRRVAKSSKARKPCLSQPIGNRNETIHPQKTNGWKPKHESFKGFFVPCYFKMIFRF